MFFVELKKWPVRHSKIPLAVKGTTTSNDKRHAEPLKSSSINFIYFEIILNVHYVSIIYEK
jgi:hypothetical protein